jgi:pantothenate kinase
MSKLHSAAENKATETQWLKAGRAVRHGHRRRAYKYYEKMKEVLGVKVLREDEMECLIIVCSPFERARNCSPDPLC